MATGSQHGKPCSVAELLAKLPEAEVAGFNRMYDRGWSEARIWGHLHAEGHKVGKQTLGRHRRGDCRCSE